MADESQNPYWERMSGAVKNVLIQAKRWSALAKKPRVYCDHIMTALVSSYPEEVKKEVPQLSADKITLILKKSSSPPGSTVSRDAVLERTIDIADNMGDDEIRVHHLAKAAAEYCNFDSYKERVNLFNP